MFEKNELVFCVKYPFSENTKEIVKWLNFKLDSIDNSVLERAKERVIKGIEKNIVLPDSSSSQPRILLTEILSYPVAKILVSLTNDNLITKQYAYAESNAMRKFLSDEKEETIKKLALELGISIHDGTVSFIDYLKNLPKNNEYRLVNVPMKEGRVYLSKELLVGILAERFRLRLEEELSKKIDVPQTYKTYAMEIKKEFTRQIPIKDINLGIVESEKFPPCIKALIQRHISGEKVPHTPRFVLATFLINVNMPIEKIVDIYRKTANFNEKKTRYYIEYSAGKRGSGVKYTSPSCDKMVDYGLCVNKDALCEKIKHPLSYYAVKKRGSHAS